MSDFTCNSCEYTTAELRDGISHATSTGHGLTQPVDNEGAMMTIGFAWDEDIVDDEDDWGMGEPPGTGADCDECECSESYRHRGEHTPGCPADDGERGPLEVGE